VFRSEYTGKLLFYQLYCGVDWMVADKNENVTCTSFYTIKMARLASGYSELIACNILGMSMNELKHIEEDSSDLTIARAQQMSSLYEVSIDSIYFGKNNIT
jgi:DNA-binding XRE family transcriptional regulator